MNKAVSCVSNCREICFLAPVVFLLAVYAAGANGLNYNLLPSSNGPAAGGNVLIITNCDSPISSGLITNVVFTNSIAAIGTTEILAHGADWIRIVVPAHLPGAVDMIIQDSVLGDTTLERHKYNYNLRGRIFPNIPQGWSEFTGLPRSMSGSVAGELNGAVHIAGGAYHTNTFRLDDNVWTELSGLPAGVGSPGGAVWSNELYCIGGYSNGVITNVFAFNGATWREAPGIPAQRQLPGAAALNGLYVIGGLPDTHATGQTNAWRLEGASWQAAAKLPQGRYNLKCATLSDRLYAIGGEDNWQIWTNVFVFDGANWSETAGLPAPDGNPTYYFTAGVVDGYIYVAGGYTGSYATVSNVYRFDGTNWTEIAGLPQKRSGGASATLDGTLYYIGGDATNVYAYRPDSDLVGVSPMSGSCTGGYSVVICGANLGDGSDITNVTLCGVSMSNIVSQSGTQVVIIAGQAAESESGDVRVYSASYGETVKSNAFTYTNLIMTVLGTNCEIIASGEAASTEKGTDFSAIPWGTAQTNTFEIDNNNSATLNISGVTTSGAGAAAFLISDLPFSVGGGCSSNFSVCFAPSNAGTYTATVEIANNSATTPYIVYLAGTGAKQEQAALTFSPASPQAYDTTNALSASGGSGTGALSYAATGPGEIVGSTNLHVTSGSGVVTVTVTKAADDMYNSIATTGTVACAKADQTITFPAIADQVVTSPVGLAATASSGLPVSFTNLSGSPVSWQSATTITFTATGTVNIAASQAGNNDWNPAPAVTNTFNVLPAPAQNGWLAIQVSPASGSWQLTTPPGYTGPASGAGNLSAVSAVTGQYIVSYGALSGYVAPSNQTGFVTGGSTTLIAAVYLQISTNISTPGGIAATKGTYTNKIRVTWNGVSGATGYEIWRSQTNEASASGRIADIPLITLRGLADNLKGRAQQPVAQILSMTDGHAVRPYLDGNSYYYDDYAINPINAYYYWVRAKTATEISAMSYVGMGYAAIDPHNASGTADIGVSDFVFLPVNMTNLSHAGTISCRVMNYGPDGLSSSGVGFDFHMISNASQAVQDTGETVWIGSAQSNMTLNAGEEELVIFGTEAKRNLITRDDLRGMQTVRVTARHLSAIYDPNPANNTTNAAGTVRIKTNGVNSIGRALNDYDGDGKADGPIYRVSDGRWDTALSGDRFQNWLSVEVGLAGLQPVPGDYDGDGVTDMAVYNHANGWWIIALSSTGEIFSGQFGGLEYTATPCDLDGDARTDPVVYRDSDGYWYGAASSRGYALEYAPGNWPGYTPVPGDYDGDGKADPVAYYNEQTAIWIFGPSSMGYSLLTGAFGGPGWLAASADYDGDGLTDPAVFTPELGTWQALLSGSGYALFQVSLQPSVFTLPVPADYDGDGKADLAVYHRDTGLWQIYLSTSGYHEINGVFGGPEFQPAQE